MANGVGVMVMNGASVQTSVGSAIGASAVGRATVGMMTNESVGEGSSGILVTANRGGKRRFVRVLRGGQTHDEDAQDSHDDRQQYAQLAAHRFPLSDARIG
ncbi:MAG: hypothetical protein SGJ24_09470, partial [Chloroflexota bacterium]|nr:hypothetical protein [Chloroflexota bacterium]